MASSIRLAGGALRELRIHLCQTTAASNGVREFIQKDYVDLKQNNRDFPILVRECSGITPRIWARYEHGVETSVSVENQPRQKIMEVINGDVNFNNLQMSSPLLPPPIQRSKIWSSQKVPKFVASSATAVTTASSPSSALFHYYNNNPIQQQNYYHFNHHHRCVVGDGCSSAVAMVTSSNPSTKKGSEWEIGERIRCLHQAIEYEAKITYKWHNNGVTFYRIHYVRWNQKWDETVGETEAESRFRAWDSSPLPPVGVPSFCERFMVSEDKRSNGKHWHSTDPDERVCLQMKISPLSWTTVSTGGNLLEMLGQALFAQLVFALILLSNDAVGMWLTKRFVPRRAWVPNSSTFFQTNAIFCRWAASFIILTSALVSSLVWSWTSVLHGLCIDLRFEPTNAPLICLLLNIVLLCSSMAELKLLNNRSRKGRVYNFEASPYTLTNLWLWL